MPVSPGIALIIGLIAGGLWIGDKVVHSKPVHTFNRGVCKVVTLGQKCKAVKK
jgi:hypothetical protein